MRWKSVFVLSFVIPLSTYLNVHYWMRFINWLEANKINFKVS